MLSTADCTFEELGHTAEIGLRLQAATAAALFTCAAQAMFQLVQPHPNNKYAPSAAGDETKSREIILSAADVESLLVDWLSELLYLYETTGLIYQRCNVTAWEPDFIAATVAGDKPKQPPALHIKAVTYHQIEVSQTPDKWQARVFFDI